MMSSASPPKSPSPRREGDFLPLDLKPLPLRGRGLGRGVFILR